jgi:hypothetical protein
LALTITASDADALIARIAAEPFTPVTGAHLLASFMVPLVREALKKPIHTNPIIVALSVENERICFELTDGQGAVVGRLRAEFKDKG